MLKRIPESLVRKDATHFRFIDGRHQFSFSFSSHSWDEPEMIQFRTVSETPCGYWITDLNNGYGRFSKRWVSKTTRKRFAYPTIEEAKNSYIIRKRRQQEYLESLLEKTKAMLTYMDEDPEEEYFSDPNQG